MLISVLVAVFSSAALPPAQAADPYVVYTANQDVDGAVILRTEPATGSLVEISRNGPQGTLFSRPYDLAAEPGGTLVVADMGVPDQKDGSIIRIDPLNGRQTLVSGGSGNLGGNMFFDPSGIAVGPDGTLWVLDNLAGPSSGAVIKVDPSTGHQELIASNLGPIVGLFDFSFGIAVDTDGSLVVVNRVLAGALPELGCPIPSGSVFRVTPGGTATQISSLLDLSRPLGVAIDTDRSIVVANECATPFGHGLVRINSAGGAQTSIAANGAEDALVTPERVAITPGGDYLVTDFNVGADRDGGIVKVARAGQTQTVVSSHPLFNHPLGIAVVPNRPPTAALSIAPTMVAAGEQVSLDASRSIDPEGQRLVYEWDLNGDGGFEAASGTTPTATPRFASDGLKTVRVRVTDQHGGHGVAEGTVSVDGSTPLVTRLRATSTVLGVGTARKRSKARKGSRSAARSLSPPRTTSLRFRLSEAATVSVGLDRGRKGRKPRGRRCSTKAKRGAACTVWSRTRVITKRGQAGDNSVALRARGLRPGRYRVTVSAVDEVGNRSSRRTLGLRVVTLG